MVSICNSPILCEWSRCFHFPEKWDRIMWHQPGMLLEYSYSYCIRSRQLLFGKPFATHNWIRGQTLSTNWKSTAPHIVEHNTLPWKAIMTTSGAPNRLSYTNLESPGCHIWLFLYTILKYQITIKGELRYYWAHVIIKWATEKLTNLVT